VSAVQSPVLYLKENNCRGGGDSGGRKKGILTKDNWFSMGLIYGKLK
jgi:hypothetical protein